jgi:hypothetical protein
MIVVADLYDWTKDGMVRSSDGYWVARREVEKLLEEAHRRGRERGLEEAKEVVRGTPA